MSFSEYAAKAEKQPKPKVKVVADYDGPSPDSPPKGHTPKSSGGKGQEGKVNPYKGGKDAKDPNKGHSSDGLAHKGDKKLSHMPAATHSEKVPHKVLGSYPLKASEWVEKTKDLSLAEFTRKIRDQRMAGLDGSSSKAYSAIKEALNVCKTNDSYITDVVLEMKRQELFETFLSIMVQQPESFAIVADLMENNDNFARKLMSALNEMVAPPVGDVGNEDDEDMHHHGDEEESDDATDMNDDDSIDDEEGDDDEEEDDGDEEASDDEDMGDDHADMGADDESGLPAHLKPMKDNPMMQKMMGYK